MVLLGALTDVAGSQFEEKRVHWIWQKLAHVVNVTVIQFNARAKALLLCGNPAAAIKSMEEMQQRGVSPDLNTHLLQVQSQLMLLPEALDQSSRSAICRTISSLV